MINTNYNHSSTSRSSGHQEGRASSGESSSAAMGGGGTPNPLAGGMPPSAPAPGPAAPMPGHHHHQQYPQPQYPQQQYPQQHAQQHHYPHQCPHPSSAPGPTAHPPPPTGQFAPSSTAPSASSSVPNPILGVAPAAASMPGIFHSPITVPKPHHPAQQFPSPLASPRMTFATAPATATAATAIAATATTAATTATTNINYNHNSNNTHESTSSGPPTNRQRRSNNTIQWEQHRNSSTNDYTHTSSESLEPVNFGTASSRKAPQFSSSNPNNNNNNNSSNINSNSNISNNNMMNIRTASSGSLASYTSYASFPSCDASHDDSATSNTNYQGSPNSKSSGANNYNNSTSATTPNSATATTAATSSNAAASSKNKNSTTTTTTNSKPTKAPPDKRLKRLERNRESARLSRRRRKHYLEELEVKVTSMSEEMDSGRITHASMAVKTLRSMRLAKLMEVERLLFGSGGVGGSAGVSLSGIGGGIGYAPLFVGSSGSSSVGVNNPLANSGGVYNNNSNNQSNNNNNQSNNNNNNNNSNNNNNHNKQQQKPPPLPIVSCNNASSTISSISKPLLEQHLRPLQTNLCRTNDELQIVNLFLKQQLMSMVQPMASKFVLWLTLQNDGFYRGGRAASERLSAARIGERLLHNGTYRASPSDGMWPLICHEISLSYDQEDKIRQCQRSILGNSASWINRHTAAATKNMIDSIDATISGMHETAKRRERSMLSVLTVEQRVAFLAWAARRGPAIRRIAAQKVGIMPDDGEAGKWKASPDRHVAANMYITDHHLAKVKQHLPPTTRFVNNPAKLKKLSRRPSFESLAGQDTDSNPKLNHDSSFPSTGSLKRSLGDVMGEDLNDQNEMQTGHTSHSSVTPESAQLAAQAAVNAALRDVLPIIPKTSFQYSHHQQYRPYAPVTSHHPQLSPMFKSNPTHLPQAVVSNHNMPQPIIHHPTPATSVNVPDPIDDIPMPTPVSVLLRTADEFITPYGTSSSTQSYSAVPEPVASCIASKFSNQHQSAPQLSQHADYPSILPAPMGMIPVPEEGALAINPLQENDDFFLEDFHMGADDWAIGEGFDMDIEEGAQMM